MEGFPLRVQPARLTQKPPGALQALPTPGAATTPTAWVCGQRPRTPPPQMRWCVHAPVQLLNYAAACILFPSACRAKLVKGGAGGGAGAGGALSDPALRSCLLALSAKVGAQPAAV